MRNAAAAALIWAAATLTAAAQEDSSNGAPFVADIVDEFIFGIYCAEEPLRRDPAPGTASGTVNIVPSLPDMPLRQQMVPAQIGIGFGVQVRLNPGLVRDVTVTITHPPYPGTGVEVEQWDTVLDGADLSLNGFSFDHETELVPGTWTFSAAAGDEVIYHIAFDVVPATLLPGAASVCSGEFVS